MRGNVIGEEQAAREEELAAGGSSYGHATAVATHEIKLNNGELNASRMLENPDLGWRSVDPILGAPPLVEAEISTATSSDVKETPSSAAPAGRAAKG